MMSKKTQLSRQVKRPTNWFMVGGVIMIGVVSLFGLLAFALQESERVDLAAYCSQNPERCTVQGVADAPVTLVEVSDFACSNCRNFYQQTAPLIEETYVATGQVRWVAVPFALRAETVPAANAALCAGEQNAYFEFAATLFERFDEPDILTREGFLQTAESLSLDTAAFTTCVDEARYEKVVRENIMAADSAGVTGTPTFFVNGRELRGAHPFATFQQRIEAWLSS